MTGTVTGSMRWTVAATLPAGAGCRRGHAALRRHDDQRRRGRAVYASACRGSRGGDRGELHGHDGRERAAGRGGRPGVPGSGRARLGRRWARPSSRGRGLRWPRLSLRRRPSFRCSRPAAASAAPAAAAAAVPRPPMMVGNGPMAMPEVRCVPEADSLGLLLGGLAALGALAGWRASTAYRVTLRCARGSSQAAPGHPGAASRLRCWGDSLATAKGRLGVACEDCGLVGRRAGTRGCGRHCPCRYRSPAFAWSAARRSAAERSSRCRRHAMTA